MVQFIHWYLNDQLIEENGDITEECAVDLLEHLEDKGMLPPLNYTKADATPSCFLKEFIDADNYYEWEPEE